MKIRINEITDWYEDYIAVSGDISREGKANVYERLAAEIREKRESEWTRGLPFVYECDRARFELAEDAVIDEAMDAYEAEHCEFDLLKPRDCDYEVIDW